MHIMNFSLLCFLPILPTLLQVVIAVPLYRHIHSRALDDVDPKYHKSVLGGGPLLPIDATLQPNRDFRRPGPGRSQGIRQSKVLADLAETINGALGPMESEETIYAPSIDLREPTMGELFDKIGTIKKGNPDSIVIAAEFLATIASLVLQKVGRKDPSPKQHYWGHSYKTAERGKLHKAVVTIINSITDRMIKGEFGRLNQRYVISPTRREQHLSELERPDALGMSRKVLKRFASYARIPSAEGAEVLPARSH